MSDKNEDRNAMKEVTDNTNERTSVGIGEVISKPRKRRQKRKLDPDTILSKALTKVLRHEAVQLGIAISSDGFIAVEDLLSLQHRGKKKNKQKVNKEGGKFSRYKLEDIQRVVANSDKQRFRLEMRIHPSMTKEKIQIGEHEEVLCIRANQGHTMKCVNEEELLTPITKEELIRMKPTGIVHGTYRKKWDECIRKEGLCRMKRNHIHFAPALPESFVLGKDDTINSENTAKVISGIRNDCNVLIFIDGKKCAEDNIQFFRSDNGVILTPGLGDRGILPMHYFSEVIDIKSKNNLLHEEEEEVLDHKDP